jgi:hypothetical protein
MEGEIRGVGELPKLSNSALMKLPTNTEEIPHEGAGPKVSNGSGFAGGGARE